MPLLSPETQSMIPIWRQKAIDGTLTIEEMKAFVAAMRGDRKSAVGQSDTARVKKAAQSVVSADELLNELKGL